MIFFKEDNNTDDSAVKMTFMTLLTVKGDKQFVELPRNIEFQRLRIRKNLSHELNESCLCSLSFENSDK